MEISNCGSGVGVLVQHFHSPREHCFLVNYEAQKYEFMQLAVRGTLLSQNCNTSNVPFIICHLTNDNLYVTTCILLLSLLKSLGLTVGITSCTKCSSLVILVAFCSTFSSSPLGKGIKCRMDLCSSIVMGSVLVSLHFYIILNTLCTSVCIYILFFFLLMSSEPISPWICLFQQ